MYARHGRCEPLQVYKRRKLCRATQRRHKRKLKILHVAKYKPRKRERKREHELQLRKGRRELEYKLIVPTA